MPARRPGFGAGPPGNRGRRHPLPAILTLATTSAPCSPGPAASTRFPMGPPARCRHGAGHGFHPAEDGPCTWAYISYPRIASAAPRGRLRDRSGPVEPGGTAGRERHCGGRQSPAGDSRPRVARGAPGGRICSRIQPGGRAKGGWGRYRGELTTARFN